MYKGSCLCGAVSFEVLVEPHHVSNCHCRMCQKQHGSAFATYASVLKEEFVYLSGVDCLSSYNSSDSIVRKFCSNCGSNIEWSGSKEYPQWISIPVACFDTVFEPKIVLELHQESEVCWTKSSKSLDC